MIYVALGANLCSEKWGLPKATLEAAICALQSFSVEVIDRSPLYESAPVPKSEQPNYLNAVIAIETDLSSRDLMGKMHQIEAEFGRVHRELNEARCIDLDLISYHEEIGDGAGGGPILPHPRLSQRSFVLLPLQDIAPDWRHPDSGASISDLIKNLPSLADIRQL